MVRGRVKKIAIWSLILVAFLPVSSAGAIPSDLSIKYSNYQVLFYNSEEECEEGTTIPGKNGPSFAGEEVWDGSCSSMTSSRIAWIKKYLSVMQKIATKNGIPWELIPAQSFQESGGGRQEACDYNPLGLKASKGHAACSNGFAKFNSHEEAFQYYMDSITPIRELKHKYPNDPYSAVAFIQYGASRAYASCDSESYSQCVGHMNEPTPGYVQSVSSIICGIQKWAKGEGIAISSVTWENYSPSSGGGEVVEEEVEEEVEVEEEKGAIYCNEDGKYSDEEDEDYEEPEAGNLESYIKAWAWPEYHKAPYTNKKPAYADYINSQASYVGSCNGVDCAAFVANIIKASGWDTSYPQTGTAGQNSWLPKNWKKVSSDSLKLGDVGIVYNQKDHHVILYVGSIPGFSSNTASASQCERAPMAGADKNLDKYTWYRKR